MVVGGNHTGIEKHFYWLLKATSEAMWFCSVRNETQTEKKKKNQRRNLAETQPKSTLSARV